MIFQKTWQQVLDGTKTQTRRPVKRPEWGITSFHEGMAYAEEGVGEIIEVWGRRGYRKWAVGRTYAVQPGRGKKAVGRIRITKIRRERLRDITEDDAQAEGMQRYQERDYLGYYKTSFIVVWDSLYRKPYRWEDNPEVWVLEFEKVEATR